MPQMDRRDFLLALGGAGLAGPARRPNVVFILADDLGWRDTSLYGSTFYETPNLERLASRGMRFEQAYAAAPICSPTRASIQTGLFPARLGITQPACHLPQAVLEQKLAAKARPENKAITPNTVTRLKLEYFTLAEALKQAGYRTGHFGKWHLGPEPYDPLHQGFEVDLPHTPAPGPSGGYLGGPWKFWRGQGAPGEHIEDRMAAEAASFIRENKNRPFFLNYWAFSVHSAWQTKAALLEKYRAKADSANPQRNPVYAGMVESLDEGVGRLMKALDENGVAGNTIVIFFSDNGGVTWTPGTEKAMLHPGFEDLPITSNSPLRGGKATPYEGGTREPCIVAWPGRIKAGSRSDAMISSVDFYPTLLAMTGARAQPGQKFDGVSFLPALQGRPFDRGPIFCHFPHYAPAAGTKPATYVREGDWKLIRFWSDSEDQTDRFELYNLKADLGESDNLAAKMPAKVKELNELIDGFIRDTGAVIPKPNPGFR